MNKTIICNWYHYIDFDGLHTIELQFINNVTGAECWKMYKNRDRARVNAIAKAAETRLFNRAARIYN